ncbi:MAG TPA: hypothetical protein VD966_12585, partial [Pyrinomonadaceae bacterium]|nr:hypothetical protein [Pyrinomonadaceae bacterium]
MGRERARSRWKFVRPQRFKTVGIASKIWKATLTAGAGMAALAALNASIRRHASDPEEAAF